jgi:non-heme chloroperoxidase
LDFSGIHALLSLAVTDVKVLPGDTMLRCKFALALLLVLPSAILNLHAQDVTGQWQGTVQSSHPLRVVLNISLDSSGKPQAYIVPVGASPDHYPVSSISVTHGELDFSGPGATYHGKLSGDGSRIDGTWTQGSPVALDFQRATEETSWLTKSTTRFITVAPGVSLEVVDWGGSGPPLVFLAGLGNTAHVFDNFAPKFVPQYHAYGITRRGFGASSSPIPNDSNYTADQLGDDVLKVMDVLGVKKPVLIGHSIAGEELSSIGSRFPDKVAGLIYLDAGYAYALYSPEFGDRELDAKDLKNALNAFLTAQSGADEKSMIASIANVLSEIRLVQKDLETFQRQFELLPPPPDSGTSPVVPFAPPAIIRGEQKYTNIQVPILAIFASPDSSANLPKMPEDKKAEFIALDQAESAAQAKAFEKLKSAKVVILPNADHFVFLSNEQEVEKDINDFLATLSAKGN